MPKINVTKTIDHKLTWSSISLYFCNISNYQVHQQKSRFISNLRIECISEITYSSLKNIDFISILFHMNYNQQKNHYFQKNR